MVVAQLNFHLDPSHRLGEAMRKTHAATLQTATHTSETALARTYSINLYPK